MKTITLEFLKTLRACTGGAEWFAERYTEAPLDEVLDALLANDHADWVRWLLPRCLSAKGAAELAIWCAEDVLPIWEARFPEDALSRKAIEAAKEAMEHPTAGNRAAAARAAYAAGAAAAGSASWEAAAASATAWPMGAAARAAARAAAAGAAADAATAWPMGAAADAAYAADAAAMADETFMPRFIAEGLRILKNETGENEK